MTTQVLFVLSILQITVKGEYRAQGVDTLVEVEGFLMQNNAPVDEKNFNFQQHDLKRVICNQLSKQLSLRLPNAIGYFSECSALRFERKDHKVYPIITMAFYHEELRNLKYYNNPDGFAYFLQDAQRTGAKKFPNVVFSPKKIQTIQVGRTDLIIPTEVVLNIDKTRIKKQEDYYDYSHDICNDLMKVIKAGHRKLYKYMLGCWTVKFASKGKQAVAFPQFHLDWENLVYSRQYTNRSKFDDIVKDALAIGMKIVEPPTFSAIKNEVSKEGDATRVNVKGMVIKDGQKIRYGEAYKLLDHNVYINIRSCIEKQLRKDIEAGNLPLGKTIYRIEVEELPKYCEIVYANVTITVSEQDVFYLGIPKRPDLISRAFDWARHDGRHSFKPETMVRFRFRTPYVAPIPAFV